MEVTVEWSADIAKEAFSILNRQDIVIGPAKDGGYYLLGMNQPYPSLFINKNWSTDNLFKETIKDMQNIGLSSTKLPVLKDVDEASDVPDALLPNKN